MTIARIRHHLSRYFRRLARRAIGDQPRPKLAFINRVEVRGETIISITRTWHRGDCRRCRLCRECIAQDNVCAVLLIGIDIPDRDAPLFDRTRYEAPQPSPKPLAEVEL